ncbi:hypothetical protein NE237_030022 [Protea cynaroides]|uniref:Sugar phosphate transporter domain-containing protein n=1 Tax=Protea cynaroides TaxID=273540 RepID=A0A9Q0GTD9_9MAGN|nr:hypothetical protein NE237_030022 [Protea cynaroides]
MSLPYSAASLESGLANTKCPCPLAMTWLVYSPSICIHFTFCSPDSSEELAMAEEQSCPCLFLVFVSYIERPSSPGGYPTVKLMQLEWGNMDGGFKKTGGFGGGADLRVELAEDKRVSSVLLLKHLRVPSVMKTLSKDEINLEDGKEDKDREKTIRSNRVVKIQNQTLLSGLAYCMSSCSMILINKFVLSTYNFRAGISLMLYQNLISVVIVSILSYLGIISTEPLTWRLIRVWFPVNIIFVGMLTTSMFSLMYINVAMVTVLKNATNVMTAIGEMYLFKKRHDSRVWAALFLMIISAIAGGITDLSFHAIGYMWQFVNCLLTASYSLMLRRVMDTAKDATNSGNLNEFSMVLLNNILSLPLGVLLIFVFNELDFLYNTPLLKIPMFWLVMTSSGFVGLAISFTSMWFLHQTGATTYSLLGSLNKIPLSIAGILLFNVSTSVENCASILFGLLAGVFFAKAKLGDR